MNEKHSNRLAQTTSPYLQQHAHNPVDWWPWCSEALERARAEDKPILLSIGYSACHWCHVMAHESFEDEKTAALMNELFVNIKVDREERPDLDKIYQNAHYLLSQRSGGWPLTIFLSSEDQTPFFSGTYFPPEPRHGLPGFRELLKNVAEAWRRQRDAIREQSGSLKAALVQLTGGDEPAAGSLNEAPLSAAVETLKQQFDRRHGGFGSAPKFPHPDNLALLLHRGDEDRQARYCACYTLEKMAEGGINDQLAGGFCRYSVDDQWMIPHFEKMLYDNGSLLSLYAQAWRDTGDELFRRAAEGIAGWVMAEMQSADGGYYSSLDADSEGEEGKFYVWQQEEVRRTLSEAEYAVFATRYGLDRSPNFEGSWHLHAFASIDTVAGQNKMQPEQVETLLDSARRKLLALRDKRVRPGRDEKILVSWNALMTHGMIRAGRQLECPQWIDSARRALDFMRTELWRNGRLLAVHKEGVSHQAAYLDDHAFLIQALLEMLQTRWNSDDLQWAMALADLLLEHFEDRQSGGFYFTADDHEQLIQRPRSFVDDATPSGNGIAAQALLSLAHLSGELRYQQAAEATLKGAWGGIHRAPHAHASLLLALEEYLQPEETLIIRGEAGPIAKWQQAALGHRRRVYAIPLDAEGLPASLAQRQPQGPVRAWLCRGVQCQPPVDSLPELEALIRPSG